jgi:hypothetical protein
LKPVEQLVDDMTLGEQVSLLSGEDFWSLPAIERLGVAKARVSDGSNGVSAAVFLVGIAIADGLFGDAVSAGRLPQTSDLSALDVRGSVLISRPAQDIDV